MSRLTLRRIASVILLAIALSALARQITLTHQNPQPKLLPIEDDPAHVGYLAVDRTQMNFPRDCVTVTWEVEELEETELNHAIVWNWGQLPLCNGHAPLLEVEYPSGIVGSYTLPRHVTFEQPLTWLWITLAVGALGVLIADSPIRPRYDNPYLRWMVVILLAILAVLVIRQFTNLLDTRQFTWDHHHYLDMALYGMFSNPALVAPFAHRPLLPFVARQVTGWFDVRFFDGFEITTTVAVIAQLIAVYGLAQHFSKRFAPALIATGVIALSTYNVKFLLHDFYRPDSLAFPLLALAMWALFRRIDWLVIGTCAVGLLTREFMIIPPVLLCYIYGRELLVNPRRVGSWLMLALTIAVTGAAVLAPRLIIDAARSDAAIAQTDALLRVFHPARLLNLVLVMAAYCLPLAILAGGTRWRTAWDQLAGKRDLLALYCLGVLGLSLIGGTDLPRFAAYLYIPLVIGLTLLLDDGINGWEVAYLLIAWAVFNRTFSAIPQTDLDAYLDAYRGYNQRISLVTLWWIVESVGWILGAWGLKRLIIAFNFRRL